jgi:hypothetical protein
MTVAAPPRTNVLALVGFVAAFVAPPAGIILGAVALRQIRTRGERGRGLALADIGIGIGMCLFYAFFVVLTLVILQVAGPTGTQITVS